MSITVSVTSQSPAAVRADLLAVPVDADKKLGVGADAVDDALGGRLKAFMAEAGFSGKPGAVLSASPGAIGGFGANHHLRQCLVFLDVYVLQQPEAYLGGAGNFFDENGVLSDGIKPFLQKFIDAYAAWVAKHAA